MTAFDTLPDLAFELTLVDEDNGDSRVWNFTDSFNWEIAVPRSGVTAVHLHFKDDGRMLWDLTTEDRDSQSDHTVVGGGEYSHDTDIGNLFGLVRDGRTYIDVHTGGATQPAIRADLTRIHFEDWDDHFCTT